MSEELKEALKKAGFVGGDDYYCKGEDPASCSYVEKKPEDKYLYVGPMGALLTNETKLLKYLKLFT